MPDWLLPILITVIPAWFLQNVIHEASHALMGKLIEGRQVLGFYPWPHMKQGRFYFARYVYGPATKLGSASPRHIAPMIAAVLLCVIWSGIMIFTRQVVFCVPMTMAIIDYLWWWRGCFWGSDLCDGKRWRRSLGQEKE